MLSYLSSDGLVLSRASGRSGADSFPGPEAVTLRRKNPGRSFKGGQRLFIRRGKCRADMQADCRPAVQRETCGVWTYIISASGEIRKNERAKPESHVESATSIFALVPTIPKKPVESAPYTVERRGLGVRARKAGGYKSK